MQAIQSFKIDVRLVEHQDAVRRKWQVGLFGDFDVMLAAIGDHNERRDGALQIQQGVDLQGPLAFAVLGPRKKIEAKMNQGGVEYFERIVELEPVPGRDVGTAREQVVVKVLKETVVPARVDIAQLGTGDVFQAQVIPGPLLDPAPGLYVAQAFFARRLGVEIDQELVSGSKMLGVAISPGTVHFAVELFRGDQI